MANARDRRPASERGRGHSSSTTGLTPGKRTLVEGQYGGSAEAYRGYAPEAHAGQPEPKQQRTEGALHTQATQITAVFVKGSTSPQTSQGGYAPKPDAAAAQQRVGLTGSPTVHAGGGNSCTLGLEVLDWRVVEDGTNWRADVTALRVSGDIHVTDWPSHPTTMTTPNTSNPVNGGNVNNTRGSANHWQAAIDDMADYDTSGVGGAGPNWHSTAASRAHEWAHWNEDYLGSCIPAGNWTQTNQDIDRMTVPKSAHPDAASARTALQPRVDARFNQFVAAVTRQWNVILANDVPGGGGRGYAAGMRVLNGLIGSVRGYAASKGWNRPAAPEAPATGTGTTTATTGTGTTTTGTEATGTPSAPTGGTGE